MSIRIYVAWRVPLDRITEATDWLHDHMWAKGKKLYGDIVRSMRPSDMKGGDKWTTAMKMLRAEDLLRTMRRELPGVRNPLNIECGWTFWIFEGRVYIIPYGMDHYYPKDEDLPDYFSDYHYQDQADRDKKVSKKTHDARHATWMKINLGEGKHDWFDRAYQHVVVDPSYTHFSKMLLEIAEEETADGNMYDVNCAMCGKYIDQIKREPGDDLGEFYHCSDCMTKHNKELREEE